jgi:hypothetical protein
MKYLQDRNRGPAQIIRQSDSERYTETSHYLRRTGTSTKDHIGRFSTAQTTLSYKIHISSFEFYTNDHSSIHMREADSHHTKRMRPQSEHNASW